MSILIDTNVFCAYANTEDVHHDKAKRIMEAVRSKQYGVAITVDGVFGETMAVMERRVNRKVAREFGHYLLNSEIAMAYTNKMVFEITWRLFDQAFKLSFTDCLCLAFMNVLHIDQIATFDKEFKRIKDVKVIDY
ncbi:MAG TPA: type II toxin-antitoxin system VapC family toxin [Candidatus Nanoarchaeia archaeon]|nr:type II toxin-antitoxin system VapC family toxin [Candidatus Nanoarchaeia archaeon]